MLAAVVAALLFALGAVQLGSDAIFARAAVPGSLPAAIAPITGVAIYRALASIAPAPYTNDMLARAALDRGDLAAAQTYAQLLPASGVRSELLARVAQARGNDAAAQRLFLNAGDFAAIDAHVTQLSHHDTQAAYALESLLKTRLEKDGTHPDEVAEAYWRLGVLAAQQHRAGAAMMNYEKALALSPISGKYLVSAGFQNYELHRWLEAQRDFQRAISVDPRSADAYAGAGMTALATGDRAAAQMYAARGSAIDPSAHAIKTLLSQLHQ